MNIEDFQNKKKVFFSYYPGDVDTILTIINYIYKNNDKIFFNHAMLKLINNDRFYNNIIFEKNIWTIKKNLNFLLIFLLSLFKANSVFVSDVNSKFFLFFLNLLSIIFNFNIIIFKHTSTPYAPYFERPKNFYANFNYLLSNDDEVNIYKNEYKLKNIIKFPTGVRNINYINILKKNKFNKEYNYCLIYSYGVHEEIYSFKDKMLDLENIILSIKNRYDDKIKIIIKKHPQEKDNIVKILEKKYKDFVFVSELNSIILSINCSFAIGIGTTGGLFTPHFLKKTALNYYRNYDNYYNYLSSKKIKFCIVENNIQTAKNLTSLKKFINHATNL